MKCSKVKNDGKEVKHFFSLNEQKLSKYCFTKIGAEKYKELFKHRTIVTRLSMLFKYVFFSIDQIVILVKMVQHLTFLIVNMERMFLEVI